jgi:hypothetical protein
METSEKGRVGELALNDWLNVQGLSYVYICQSKETFASLFSIDIKRPDFLILLESVGLLAVDVKNYSQYREGEYTLKLEKELHRAITFERIFRMPLWYAYYSEEDDKKVWYWISALKAIEVGTTATNKKNEEYKKIHIDHFERIETNSDLGKLYTHRLGSLRKISKLVTLN